MSDVKENPLFQQLNNLINAASIHAYQLGKGNLNADEEQKLFFRIYEIRDHIFVNAKWIGNEKTDDSTS